MSQEVILSQFLIDITRGHKQKDFKENPRKEVAASSLDNHLKEAILKQDINSLWKAGAAPMALLYFSRLCGWDMDRYYASISE